MPLENFRFDRHGRARVVALLVSVWMWATPVLAAVGEQVAEPQQVSQKAQRLVLLVGVTTLLLAFLFVGVILIRALRHVRQEALRKETSPTDASDVWVMHRVPDDALESGDNERSDEAS
jgi:hypothetical protein